MTITMELDIHEEMLVRYALGLAVQKCRRDKAHSDSQHDVVSSYRSKEIEQSFREIERKLHALEVAELRKLKEAKGA